MLQIRKEALKKGLDRYSPVKTCARGHLSDRYTSTGHCIECLNLTQKIYSEQNKEQISINKKIYRLENSENLKKYNKLYKINNKGKVNALKAKRKALKMQRTPLWSNLEEIDLIYIRCAEISKTTGIIHHVDHIIPLQSELVCGLHVHNNLQILTASENCSKSNNFEII